MIRDKLLMKRKYIQKSPEDYLPVKPEKPVLVSTRLPHELWDRVQEFASARGLALSDIIKAAVSKFMDEAK